MLIASARASVGLVCGRAVAVFVRSGCPRPARGADDPRVAGKAAGCVSAQIAPQTSRALLGTQTSRFLPQGALRYAALVLAERLGG